MNLPNLNDDYFFLRFEQNDTNAKLNLFKDGSNEYELQDDIDSVFSHLVFLDEARKEQIKDDGNLQTEQIKFSISFANENGKSVTENFDVPLGFGHFQKGINHIRENFKTELSLNSEKSPNIAQKLAEKCKALSLPPKIDLDSLKDKGFNTLDKCAEIAKAFSNDEMSAFLKGFQAGISKDEKNKKQKNIAEMIKSNMKDGNTKDNEISQESINKIKEKSKLIAKNQKKSKNPIKELSTQNPSLGHSK